MGARAGALQAGGGSRGRFTSTPTPTNSPSCRRHRQLAAPAAAAAAGAGAGAHPLHFEVWGHGVMRGTWRRAGEGQRARRQPRHRPAHAEQRAGQRSAPSRHSIVSHRTSCRQGGGGQGVSESHTRRRVSRTARRGHPRPSPPSATPPTHLKWSDWKEGSSSEKASSRVLAWGPRGPPGVSSRVPMAAEAACRVGKRGGASGGAGWRTERSTLATLRVRPGVAPGHCPPASRRLDGPSASSPRRGERQRACGRAESRMCGRRCAGQTSRGPAHLILGRVVAFAHPHSLLRQLAARFRPRGLPAEALAAAPPP